MANEDLDFVLTLVKEGRLFESKDFGLLISTNKDYIEEVDGTQQQVKGVSFAPPPLTVVAALQYLIDEKYVRSKEYEGTINYHLTPTGIFTQQNGGFVEKELRDLEKYVKEEDFRELQKEFWKSGIERDKRQRWQFWLTFLIGIAAFLLSIINFVKDIVLPK